MYTKKEIKSYLKKSNFKEIGIDQYCNNRLFDTFTDYKKEILIHAGKYITFCLNFKKTKTNDFFSYSAICANGIELQMNLERCFNILQKYINLELSENDIINYISK